MDTKKTSKYANFKAKNRKPVRAVGFGVTGTDRREAIMSAAERVIATHGDVIKALAKR